MSAQMQTERAATEVTTPLAGTQRASAASVLKDSTARPEREPLSVRVQRFLRDLQQPTALQRYRESEGQIADESLRRIWS